jgi:hypothetical protein
MKGLEAQPHKSTSRSLACLASSACEQVIGLLGDLREGQPAFCKQVIDLLGELRAGRPVGLPGDLTAGRPAIRKQVIDLLGKLFAEQVIDLLSKLFTLAEQVTGLLGNRFKRIKQSSQ